MKKTIYYAAIFLFCSAAVSASNSNGIITLLEPSVTATRNKLLVISGRVETPAIKQVNISVEPFTF
ncbi:MAG: hypothetical protein A3J83_03640 [Elusimicrobia bacterium RIFOXYA2_FULL_40_6]|nr:MAG: hypothetical protein A3J83_03640 [Elusimicrobia bacterium RIFOXYA2_FULL_40_6]